MSIYLYIYPSDEPDDQACLLRALYASRCVCVITEPCQQGHCTCGSGLHDDGVDGSSSVWSMGRDLQRILHANEVCRMIRDVYYINTSLETGHSVLLKLVCNGKVCR